MKVDETSHSNLSTETKPFEMDCQHSGQFISNITRNSQDKSQSKVKNLFDPTKLICSGKNQGAFYCAESLCNNYAISCGKQECECQKLHSDCKLTYRMKGFNKDIQSKLRTDKFIKVVDQRVLEMEGIICKMQQVLQKQMDYFGLTELEKQFVERLEKDFTLIDSQEKNSHYELTGNVVKQFGGRPNIDKYQRCQEQIKHQTSIVEKVQVQLGAKFKELIHEIKKNCKEGVYKFNDSMIVKEDKEILKLEKMVNELNISKSQLVFRGSVDGMSMEEFHSKCDNKPNLLYLVENEFGKKYGAYCPCCISIDRLSKYEIDESMSSFVFSLDLNKKAKVIKKKYAICNGYKGQKWYQLVSFGINKPCRLVISANSLTKEEKNWITFYSPNSDSSYQTSANPPLDVECLGTQQSKSKLKEFEVYQIHL